MTHAITHTLAGADFSALAPEQAQWESFMVAARSSVFTPMLRQGNNNPGAWRDLSIPEKEAVWGAFAKTHHCIFDYPGFAPEIYDAQDLHRTPGFWGVVQYEIMPSQENMVGLEGEVCVPDIKATGAFQLMIYGLAKNYLYDRVATQMEDDKGEIVHDSAAWDVYKFETHIIDGTNFSEVDARAAELMKHFPMPDAFESWLDLPSNRYALQAAAQASGEVLGYAAIDAEALALLKTHFLGLQANMVTEALNEDDILCRGDAAFCAKWAQRAKLLFEQSLEESPLPFVSKFKLLSILSKNDVPIHLPPRLSDEFKKDLGLRAAAIGDRDAAVPFIADLSRAELKALTDEQRMHLIHRLGPQQALEEDAHKKCDAAAAAVLDSMPIHPTFAAYYQALFMQLGDMLRAHAELNTLADHWTEDAAIADKLAFLVKLNEEVSTYFGIRPPGVFLFEQEERQHGRYTRGALGFASTVFSNANKAQLQGDYGLQLPENFSGSLIGLNTHKKYGLFDAPTPRRASSVLVHEIGHHVHYDLRPKLLRGELGKNDPRYSYIQSLETWDSVPSLEHRLRREFSLAVYPHIPSEKFSYWCMDAFEQERPFAFNG